MGVSDYKEVGVFFYSVAQMFCSVGCVKKSTVSVCYVCLCNRCIYVCMNVQI